nr:hypothetical protein [Tanacetum cinerariifolium]
MNYLEVQTDGEAIFNSIQNGDHPLPVITQVSLAGTTSNVPPHLKDKSMWSAEEKKKQKIDHLARSLLIQGLPNDIYSLIDINNFDKELWDALERHMLGSEYGEQDRKASVLYEIEKVCIMMRQSKNLMDINIDALYNILKQNQEYYDNSTNYGLFMDNDDDQEIFQDAVESASKNFNENRIVSQIDHDESEVDHNDSE